MRSRFHYVIGLGFWKIGTGLLIIGNWVRAPDNKEIKDLKCSILSRLYCKLPLNYGFKYLHVRFAPEPPRHVDKIVPMTKSTKAKVSDIRFIHEYIVKYGLKITQHSPKTMEVISVRCEFCVYFGPKEDSDKVRKRAKKDTKMTWTNNFRADLYQHHHKGEHSLA